MKRFVFFLVLITLLAISYVSLQVKIVSLSYAIKKAYQEKESLVCKKQYYMSKVLAMTSPEQLQERLIAKQVYLYHSAPKKVVRVSGKSVVGKKRGVLSALFGMPQAVADVVE